MLSSVPSLLTLVAALQSPSAYVPPNIRSPLPSTLLDNVVESFPLVQTSPLELVLRAPLPVNETWVHNAHYGRLERYVRNASGVETLQSSIVTSRSVVSVGMRPNSEEIWFVDTHARADVAGSGRGAVMVFQPATQSYSDVIAVGQQPAGITFDTTGSRAFVTCEASRELYVIDTSTHAVVSAIALDVFRPRAITFLPRSPTTADDDLVVIASFVSGNNTSARTNGTGTQPEVIETIAASSGATPLPDEDLIVLQRSTTSFEWALADTSSAKGLMTVLYNITSDPNSNKVYVVGTEALNTTAGERNFVGGSIVENRLAIVDFTTLPPVPVSVPLNGVLAGNNSLGTPTDFVVSPTQPGRGWLVARGVDRVVEFNLNLNPPTIVGFWNVVSADPNYDAALVGVRNAAIDASGQRLAVYCEIEGSFASIDVTGSAPSAGATITTTELSYNPLGRSVRRGMAHASDTRRSANSSSSCTSCHIDGGTDAMLWELSKFFDAEGTPRSMLQFEEDYKGPMITQTLHGVVDSAPYHWRGEQRNLREFNATFAGLMEGAMLTPSELDDLTDYMNALRHPANPRQPLDREFDDYVAKAGVGDADVGRAQFLSYVVDNNNFTCATCHSLPTGTRNEIMHLERAGPPVNSPEVASLRSVFDRLDEKLTTSIGGGFGFKTRIGSGLVHNAQEASLQDLAANPIFHVLNNDPATQQNLVAFLECFDTGLAPSTGYVRSLDGASTNFTAEHTGVMRFVDSQASAGHADFIALIGLPLGPNGSTVQYRMFFDAAAQAWVPNTTTIAPLPTALLATFAQVYEVPLTIMGAPRGAGTRRVIDADADELLDVDEFAYSTDPFDGDSDDDGRPDGFEVGNGTNPDTVDTWSAPNPPSVTGSIDTMFATTFNAKLELITDVPTRVQPFVVVPLLGRLPLEGLTSTDFGGGFTRHHQLILQQLPYEGEVLTFFATNVLPLELEISEPSGRTTTVSYGLSMQARVPPVVVKSIQLSGFDASVNEAKLLIEFGEGTVDPMFMPPVSAMPGCIATIDVYLGKRSAPGSDELIALTPVLGGPSFQEAIDPQQGLVGFRVTLPTIYASGQDYVLTVNVQNVVDSPFGGAKAWVQTQSFKRNFEIVDLP